MREGTGLVHCCIGRVGISFLSVEYAIAADDMILDSYNILVYCSPGVVSSQALSH